MRFDDMQELRPKPLGWGIISACAFGAAFWWFQELVQPWVAGALYGCGSGCERCANIIYDRAQLVCALGAAVACGWWFFARLRSVRGIIKTLLICWLSFQVFSLWTAWQLLQRSECTALYAPGPVGPAGFVIVGLVLLYQSGYWALRCAIALLILGALRRMLAARADELQRLDLRER